jgi:hypothetical protein
MNLSDKLLYYAIHWTMRLVPRQPLSHAALPPLCPQRARLCARHARMRTRMRVWLSPGGWVRGCLRVGGCVAVSGWVGGRMKGWDWMGRPGGWVGGRADGWMGMDAAADVCCRHGEQHETDQARVAMFKLCVHWDTSGVLPVECPAAAPASLSGCPQGEAPMIPALCQECRSLGLLSPVRGSSSWHRISEPAPVHSTVNFR